jgi:FdhD protein
VQASAPIAPASGNPEDGRGDAVERPETRYRDGEFRAGHAALAVETPVSLEFNGTSHAVMLATPADLEDFALGFSLAEGILESPSELYATEIREARDGLVVELTVSSQAFENLRLRRRTLAGRTGCGLCGTESLDQVIRPLAALAAGGPALVPEAIARAGEELALAQDLGGRTGATHAAAWCSAQGEVRMVREDVGRHNALDKLVGAMARGGHVPGDGFAFVTSRASVEMVQKAVSGRFAVLVAVSAPTTLAVDLAEQWGLALVGFARGGGFSIYAHAERVRSIPVL